MNLLTNRGIRGSALLIVLFVAAALLTMGSALAAISLTETIIADNQEQDLRLYYITEAGVEAGLAALGRCVDCCEKIEGEIGGGGYTVTVEPLPLDQGHPYYEQLQHLQPGSPGERLIISTGRLKGQEAVQAVIAAPPPLLGRALAATARLDLESSTVSGGLYAGAEFSVSGENFLCGSLRCAAPGGVCWADSESTLTVSSAAPGYPGGGLPTVVTYSETRPLPETLQAPAPALPRLNRDRFLREDALVYPCGQEWSQGPPGAPAILVQGDLLIEPGPGEEFALNGRVVLVEGDLEIRACKGAAVNLVNCIFVVEGGVNVAGPVNRGSGPGCTALFFSQGEIALGAAGGTGEEPIFGGGLLLCSKSRVEVGNEGPESEFKVMGAIIAKEVSLRNCSLCYEPEIYATAGELLDLEVVIKEWIKPWKR